MRPLPQNTTEWLAEIADAYADAYEALPFMPLVDVEPDESHLFHMAPRVALKFRGLPEHQADAATEAALSSYVASKDQVGAALDNPHVAFAFCYLAAHFGLEIVGYEIINEVMAFIEGNKDFLAHSIAHRTHKEMTELDKTPIIHSKLAQSVTRDGKTVHVEIYEDGAGSWLLEVVDEYGNSTVWDDPFPTDQDALDEVLKAIKEDGIDSLIGAPSEKQEPRNLDQPLTEAELNELDDFLANAANEDASMDVSTLDGFLTAISIGPRFVRPSEWLPWVWDMDEGEVEAEFENEEQADRIMSLVLRHYNTVIDTFNTDPSSFEPIFWRGTQWGAAEWCEGFITGFLFNEESLLAVD
jgi:hypothetical protein